MTKKAFNELTARGQQARLAKYAAQDAQYGLKEGLFRITRATRHDDRQVSYQGKTNTVASFGFNVVPVKGVDTADFAANTFTWVNQIINVDTGAAVIDAMDELIADLKNPATKSILASIKYKKSANGYMNVSSLFRRDQKKAAAKPATATAKNLPFNK